jgi:AbrB family looped-hinge helix DNA binding protein
MIHVTKIGQGGRVVIPARLRAAAGIAVGDDVIVRLEDGEIRVISYAESVRRAQEVAKPYLAEGDVVAELIAERRAEAERE